MVLAHNHPSSSLLISQEDHSVTRLLTFRLREYGVRLLDHLIFSGDVYTSMYAEGLL